MALVKLYNRYTKKPLRLYWWLHRPPAELNFGDEITPMIIERLTGRRSVWTAPDKCDFAGAGSIIEILQKKSNGKFINVWGSGFIKPGPKNELDNLNFLAVRGKLSLSRISKNVPLGDPGLLASIVWPNAYNVPKKNLVGIVPHYVDQDHDWIAEQKNKKGFKIINVFDTPEQVAIQINSCSLILSSSLHGLIVSDSYNVPNYWLPLSAELTGGDYKFRDYYSVFGLEDNFAKVDYKNFKENQAQSLIDNFVIKKSISNIQKDLLRAMVF